MYGLNTKDYFRIIFLCWNILKCESFQLQAYKSLSVSIMVESKVKHVHNFLDCVGDILSDCLSDCSSKSSNEG